MSTRSPAARSAGRSGGGSRTCGSRVEWWAGFDPADRAHARERHVVLAWARSHRDVAPLRGM